MIDSLIEALRAEGGTLAAQVVAPDDAARSDVGPAQIAASGPRAANHSGEYELLLEMIYEGSLLHYGTARVIRTEDPDLALLLGDQLYALGLARLAALGDLEAVDVLAEVISSLAQAHAEGAPDRASAIWDEGAMAIGWGLRDGEGSASGPRDARRDVDGSLSPPDNSAPTAP